LAIASSYKRTSAPGLPFTVADARYQLKNEEENYDDTLIESLAKAAGELAENKTGRAFMQSTWKFLADDFPCSDRYGFVTLRPGPLVSVTSIKYYPADGGAQVTMAAGTDYEVDTNNTPGRVRFLESLPGVAERYDAVEIIFVAGYGAAAAEVTAQQAAIPPDVVAWMKLQMTTLYEYRQLYLNGQSLANINTFADSLIYPYII
jgi:uncharacterized phiE125 gp8 family phage protein